MNIIESIIKRDRSNPQHTGLSLVADDPLLFQVFMNLLHLL